MRSQLSIALVSMGVMLIICQNTGKVTGSPAEFVPEARAAVKGLHNGMCPNPNDIPPPPGGSCPFVPEIECELDSDCPPVGPWQPERKCCPWACGQKCFDAV